MSDTNGSTTAEAPKDGKKRETKPMDMEIKAISHVNRIMEELNEDARRRVGEWIHDKWVLSPSSIFMKSLNKPKESR